MTLLSREDADGSAGKYNTVINASSGNSQGNSLEKHWAKFGDSGKVTKAKDI